jgi:transglutaminase-like putative cysteine protease
VLAAFAAIHAPAARAGDAPDWLRAAAAAPLPKYPDDTKAIVLLDDETVTIQANGEDVIHERIAYKIVRSSGRDRGVLSVPFTNPGSKVTSVKGWCIPATGKEMSVNEKDSVVRGKFEDEGGPSDEQVLFLRAPAPDPGNVVGFEYEVRTRPDLLQEEWDFQGHDPIHLAHFTLQVPSGWEYKIRWVNHPQVSAQQDGPNQWHWEVQDVPAIDDEDAAPPEETVEGRAMVDFFPTDAAVRQKTFDSWKDFGLWQSGLAAGRRNDTPEIEAKVKELTANATTPLDKMRAITLWVQSQIRYYAVEIGIGGWQPHAAAQVFANRYGDCKDMTTLLSTMLKDVGIDSYYVFISSERGLVRPDDPPAAEFDHAILAIKLPAGVPTVDLYALYQHPRLGTLLFFDSTDNLDPLGYIPPELQANYAMLVTDQGGELVELPLLAPGTNRMLRYSQFSLDSFGSLQGSVREIRWGEPATDSRAQIHAAEAKDPGADVLETFLAHFVPGAELTHANAENLDDIGKSLVLNYQFVAQNYAQPSGDLILLRPRVVGEWSSALLENTAKPRLYPVDLGATSLWSDIVEISPPPGYVVDDLPSPTKLDYPFASYTSKVEWDGKVLRYTRTMQVKSVLVPNEQLGDLKKFYEQINEDESTSAILKRAAN